MKRVPLFFFFFGMIQSKNVLNWDSEAGSELLTPEHFLLIHSSRMFGFSSAAQTGISLSHCMSAEGQSITWPCIFRWLDHRGLTREEGTIVQMENLSENATYMACVQKTQRSGMREVSFHYFCQLHKLRSFSNHWCNRPDIKWCYFLLCLTVLWLGPFLTKSICPLFYAGAFSCT